MNQTAVQAQSRRFYGDEGAESFPESRFKVRATNAPVDGASTAFNLLASAAQAYFSILLLGLLSDCVMTSQAPVASSSKTLMPVLSKKADWFERSLCSKQSSS